MRVGVIAEGIAGLADAQASGDLPALAGQQDFTGEGVDGSAEGTAMLEIVHDVAPNAALYFAAATTDAEMIEAVDYLARRTDVVVDDLSFHFPDDQRSAVSLNTAAALNHPGWPIRAYVTAAGNWALRHYEGEFRAGPGGRTLGLTGAGPVHLFGRDGATDQLGRGEAPYNEIRLESGDELRAVLHWNDPWGDSINDYDLFLLDESGAVVASGAAQQGVSTRNPRERIVYQHDGESGRFRLFVQNAGGRAAPRRLEMFAFGPKALEPDGTILNFNTTASSLLAQSDAPGGVITIAAVGHAPADFRRARPYSSRGPTNNGARKPDLAAVDNVAITGGGDFASPFFGTSAAAPHVAALAALLLEARPQLLAEDGGRPDRERELLRHVLTGSAIDLAPPGPDDATGAGRVDALAAATLLDATALVVDRDVPAGPGSLRAAIDAVNQPAANRPAGGPRAIFIDAGLSIPLTAALPPITRGDVSLSGAATIVGDRLPAGAPGPRPQRGGGRHRRAHDQRRPRRRDPRRRRRGHRDRRRHADRQRRRHPDRRRVGPRRDRRHAGRHDHRQRRPRRGRRRRGDTRRHDPEQPHRRHAGRPGGGQRRRRRPRGGRRDRRRAGRAPPAPSPGFALLKARWPGRDPRPYDPRARDPQRTARARRHDRRSADRRADRCRHHGGRRRRRRRARLRAHDPRPGPGGALPRRRPARHAADLLRAGRALRHRAGSERRVPPVGAERWPARTSSPTTPAPACATTPASSPIAATPSTATRTATSAATRPPPRRPS